MKQDSVLSQVLLCDDCFNKWSKSYKLQSKIKHLIEIDEITCKAGICLLPGEKIVTICGENIKLANSSKNGEETQQALERGKRIIDRYAPLKKSWINQKDCFKNLVQSALFDKIDTLDSEKYQCKNRALLCMFLLFLKGDRKDVQTFLSFARNTSDHWGRKTEVVPKIVMMHALPICCEIQPSSTIFCICSPHYTPRRKNDSRSKCFM